MKSRADFSARSNSDRSPLYDVRKHASRSLVRDAAADSVFRGRKVCSATPAIKPSGGARRDRTDDLMLAKHALSQLSYGPVTRRRMPRGKEERSMRLVGLGRLELPTSRLSSARSNQLSYKPQHKRLGPCTQPTQYASNAIAQAQPLARVRPRRKRNEDGEIPPMELIGSGDRWPLMFLKRSDRSA